jgi:hypothetical protein
MTRARLSTTVDRQLLDDARRLRPGTGDTALIEEALNSLLMRYRLAEVDASYRTYETNTRSTSRTSGAIWTRFGEPQRDRDEAVHTRRRMKRRGQPVVGLLHAHLPAQDSAVGGGLGQPTDGMLSDHNIHRLRLEYAF